MAAPEYIVSLDCGTSKIKAIAVNLRGKVVDQTSTHNVYTTRVGGRVEQDMLLTWKKARTVLRELIERLPHGAKRVLALTVTGQGDGTWLIDRAGEPVSPGFLWLDSRAAGVLSSLVKRKVHEQLFPYTGTHLNACNQSTQLLWLKKHAPDLLKRTHTAFHCKEWIYFKLTGERVADVSEACFTFGNFKTREIEPEVLRILGLKSLRHIIPPVLSGEEKTHALSQSAARAIGLPQGLPVVLGYVDVICATIGSGAYSRVGQRACSIVGSTGMHIRAYADTRELLQTQDFRTRRPGGYTIVLPQAPNVARMYSNMAATLNFDWMAKLFSHESEDFLRKQDRFILKARPARALYHPYIDQAGERGPFNDTTARAQFLGLSHDVTSTEMLRSVYEGVAYAARHCYTEMGSLPKTIYLSGGGFASKSFRKIFASVLHARLRQVAHSETGALGAAVIGTLSLGMYRTLHDACSDLVEKYVIPASSRDPASEMDPSLARLYDKMFNLYQDAVAANQPLWHKLAAISDRD